MTDNVKPLRLAPKFENLLAQDAIELLEEVLAEAKAGQIASVLILSKRPDGAWNGRRTGVSDYPAAIGRLEIFKQEWIEEYLKDRANEAAGFDEPA